MTASARTLLHSPHENGSAQEETMIVTADVKQLAHDLNREMDSVLARIADQESAGRELESQLMELSEAVTATRRGRRKVKQR